MSKLHELLAVEADLAQASQKMLEDCLNTFAKKPDHFEGQTRSVRFFDESREGENLEETKELVSKVSERLEYALKFTGKYYDALLKKESANQTAVADLVVNGVTIAKDVPATFLLGMETRLKAVRQVLLAIPTLAPSVAWAEDVGAGQDVFLAPTTVSFKTEKTFRHKVLVEPTDKHPAQVREWTEDVPVARVETVKRSTMWSPARKARAIERCDELLHAVKKARQRANTVEVTERAIAKDMFAYILGV